MEWFTNQQLAEYKRFFGPNEEVKKRKNCFLIIFLVKLFRTYRKKICMV